MLEAKNIEKSFGKLKVLNKINLTVEKGERVVIIGPSGSGKSTFLRCLNLLEKPNKGEVIYNGKVITDNNKLEMRKKIGMVFQSFNLFKNLTVLENLTLAPVKEKILTEKEANKKAAELLKEISLHDKIGRAQSELQSRFDHVCRLLLEKKKTNSKLHYNTYTLQYYTQIIHITYS